MERYKAVLQEYQRNTMERQAVPIVGLLLIILATGQGAVARHAQQVTEVEATDTVEHKVDRADMGHNQHKDIPISRSMFPKDTHTSPVPVYVNNYGKADHSIPGARRRNQRLPWGKLPAEPSFGWVGQTNFGRGAYKQFSGNDRAHHEEFYQPKKESYDHQNRNNVDEGELVRVGYHGEEELQAGYADPQDSADHAVSEPGYDYSSPDGQGLDPGPQYNDDRTFGSVSHHDSEDDSSDFTEQDRRIVVEVDEPYQPTELNNDIATYDDNSMQFDDREGDEDDRHLFELEYDHSGNNNFLLPGNQDDFNFNSNEIYISDEDDDELSRHERGFDEGEDHFLAYSFDPVDNTDNRRSHFGFEDLATENVQHDGFGNDDLFYKQKVDARSSELDFDEFYEPEKSNEYGNGNGPPHRGYGFHLGLNGQQRSSQEFGDIFGGKPKPARPDIVPGF
jgi:hypothetical protein